MYSNTPWQVEAGAIESQEGIINEAILLGYSENKSQEKLVNKVEISSKITKIIENNLGDSTNLQTQNPTSVTASLRNS